jgi:hypothetical protein
VVYWEWTYAICEWRNRHKNIIYTNLKRKDTNRKTNIFLTNLRVNHMSMAKNLGRRLVVKEN